MRCRRPAGIVALAMLPVLPLEGAPAPCEAVPFTLTGGGAVIVPVFVEGRGPHRFLVDTGANGSAVARSLAERLGLAPVAKRLVVTPAGDETRLVVDLGRVSVGAAAADALLASIVDADRLRIDGTEVDGVLGQDFLARFDYTIDYRRRVLVWEGLWRAGTASAWRCTAARGASWSMSRSPEAATVRSASCPTRGRTGWWSSSARAASAWPWIRCPVDPTSSPRPDGAARWRCAAFHGCASGA